MRFGANNNTILEFKKEKINNKFFDLHIGYSSCIDADSHMEICIQSITNNGLLNIRDEIDKLIMG